MRRRGLTRWLEYGLLFAGLLALDYFVWVRASSALSQAYESWSFEQELRGEPCSARGFLHREWDGLLRRPAVAVLNAPAPGQRTVAPDRFPNRSVLGRVEIPRLNLNVMIREGVDGGTLQRAVGHVPSTSLPGEAGNVALAAHRDTFFLPLENIKTGDRIQVKTYSGTYEYVVESTKVVTPRDVWVLNAVNHPTLTLVTCFPFHYIGSAPQRFIVRAAQVGQSPLSSPTPSGS